MKCEQARNLIALDPDAPLPVRQTRALRDHLLRCSACRAYRQRLATTMSELSADAEFVAAGAELSSDFWRALRPALAEQARVVSGSAAAALERLLRRPSRWPATRLGQTLRAVATLAGLIAATAFTASLIQSPPPEREAHRYFGHLASFDARTSEDGRVYAALTERHSIARRSLKEAYRK